MRKVQVWIYSLPFSKEQKKSSDVRVLLLKLVDSRGGYWQPITGGVEEGESLEDAALREAQEETGFSFTKTPRPVGYSFRFQGRWGEAEETAFALQAPMLNPPVLKEFDRKPRLDPKEHLDFQWVTPNEALQMLHYESNREGLRKMMKIVMG